MAEIAGLGIGVAGLAGLYGSVIEAFGQICAAHSFSRDLEVLSTRFDIRRTRMLQWGDGVALLSQNANEQDSRLAQVDLHPLLERALNCIRILLTDTDTLRDKYGLKPVSLEQECCHSSGDTVQLISQSRLQSFNKSFMRFKKFIETRQKRTSTLKKTHWAIHGAESFRLLLNDLDSLIEDL